MLTGSCLCGAVRYEIKGPLRVHYCHCTMCRRATGSPAAVLGWVKREQLTWCGNKAPAVYRSSRIAVRKFCGTPLALAYDGGTEIALHIGTLHEAAEH